MTEQSNTEQPKVDSTNETSTPLPKRKRTWQFSLRALMVLKLVCICGFAYYGYHWRRELIRREAVNQVEAAGGTLTWDEDDPNFAHVRLDFLESYLGLQNDKLIAALKRLDALSLRVNLVSGSLEQISRLQNLEYLWVKVHSPLHQKFVLGSSSTDKLWAPPFAPIKEQPMEMNLPPPSEWPAELTPPTVITNEELLFLKDLPRLRFVDIASDTSNRAPFAASLKQLKAFNPELLILFSLNSHMDGVGEKSRKGFVNIFVKTTPQGIIGRGDTSLLSYLGDRVHWKYAWTEETTEPRFDLLANGNVVLLLDFPDELTLHYLDGKTGKQEWNCHLSPSNKLRYNAIKTSSVQVQVIDGNIYLISNGSSAYEVFQISETDGTILWHWRDY